MAVISWLLALIVLIFVSDSLAVTCGAQEINGSSPLYLRSAGVFPFGTRQPYKASRYYPDCFDSSASQSFSESLSGVFFENLLKWPANIVPGQDTCLQVASFLSYPNDSMAALKQAIDDGALLMWYVGDLPAIHDGGEAQYSIGMPLGSMEIDTYYINNVWMFEFDLTDPKHVRTVQVDASSIMLNSRQSFCERLFQPPFDHVPLAENTRVDFYIFVRWRVMGTSFNDLYADPYSHIWGVLYGLLTTIVVSVMVALVVARIRGFTFMKSIQGDDPYESSGWKVIRFEIFRAPVRPLLLSVLIGTGSQALLTLALISLLGLIGAFCKYFPFSIATYVLFVYSVCGFACGFFSARAYRAMGRADDWKRNLLITTLCPSGILWLILLILNLSMDSSSIACWSLWTFMRVTMCFVFLHVPLSLAGGYVAMRVLPNVAFPVGVGEIPRQVPAMVWYMNSKLLIFVGGALPFVAVLGELHVLLYSFWNYQMYGAWVYLFLSALFFLTSAAAIALVVVYSLLCCEDWNWWWTSFMAPAAAGFYVAVYSLLSWADLPPSSAYASFSFMVSSLLVGVLCALLAGAMGFYCTLFFLMRIYQESNHA